MHLLGWDYPNDRIEKGVGLDGLSERIAAVKADAAATLLVDNGDFLQGTLLGDWHVTEWRRGRAPSHPMTTAMEELGYDAVTLGNHEFDYGLDYLSAVCRHAAFPIVSANLHRPNGSSVPLETVRPWVLIDRMAPNAEGVPTPLRIGVFGVMPPQTMNWNRRVMQGHATVSGIVEASTKAVTQLRNAGADLVVALSHSGIVALDHPASDENASLRLAEVPGIDAIVAGHTHKLFPGPDHDGILGVDSSAGTLADTPAVMPGCWGSHLGQIDLALRHHETQGWSATVQNVRLHTPTTTPETGKRRTCSFPRRALAAHESARAWGAQPFGQSLTPLHSYFTPVHSGAACDLMAQAQLWGLMQHVDDPDLQALPVLSAVSPFRSGGRAGPSGYVDIPAGPLTRAAAAMLFPFPNELRALVIDGRALRDWLDHAMAQFTQITPGAGDRPLLIEDWLAHNFDVVVGVHYRIDLTVAPRPSGRDGRSRISEIRHHGRPITDGSRFLLVTNEYRANGGGGFPGCTPQAVVAEPRITAQEALEGFLADRGPYRMNGSGSVFEFDPVEGASAIVVTGPGAARHLGADGVPYLEPLGQNAEGFDRYRLRLS
ncbi:MAG: 5'-nucleotidase C-terminal domain-containing protein [Pseudomonadota bacterium]